MRLIDAFARISDHAKLESRPEPVITTDFSTGRLILALLSEELGGAVNGTSG